MATELERRPLVVAALALIVGLTAGMHPGHLCFAFLLVVLLRTSRAAMMVALGLLTGLVLAPEVPMVPKGDLPVRGVATVISVPDPQAGFRLEYQGLRIRAYSEEGLDVALGDQLWISGTVTAATNAILPNGPVGLIRLRRGAARVVGHGSAFARLAQDWRLAFLRFSRRTLGVERAAFADALCFDVTDGLTVSTIDDFKKTGTIHILSASGFHVIVFSALVGGLLSVLPIPRPLQLVILGAILALYAVAAGFSAPIVRAVAMAMVARTAYLVRREPDFLSGLAAAAIGILLWQPEQLFSPGFQLSFITVAGLGMGYLSAKHPVFGAAVGSFVATVASAPLVAYHYGVLPVHSIPANLLIEVPVSIIVGLSMLLFPIGWGGPMEWVVGPCIDWVRLVLHFLASQAGSQVQIPEFNAYWLLLVYGLAVMLWRPRHVQP